MKPLTEKEIIINALKRMENDGIISDLDVEENGVVSYFAPDRIGYYPTFKFNNKGEMIHAGVDI